MYNTPGTPAAGGRGKLVMLLDRIFKLKENNTSVYIELIAGFTTFMTMSYIIFVNPGILQKAGLPFAPAMASTCLSAAVVTFLMRLATNYPFALASVVGGGY